MSSLVCVTANERHRNCEINYEKEKKKMLIKDHPPHLAPPPSPLVAIFPYVGLFSVLSGAHSPSNERFNICVQDFFQLLFYQPLRSISRLFSFTPICHTFSFR